MQFNDENQYKSAPPAKAPQPWPIKLALKYGAKNEKQAATVVVAVSILLLIVTAIIYKNLFFSSNQPEVNLNDIPPEIRAEMEADGIDLSDL